MLCREILDVYLKKRDNIIEEDVIRSNSKQLEAAFNEYCKPFFFNKGKQFDQWIKHMKKKNGVRNIEEVLNKSIMDKNKTTEDYLVVMYRATLRILCIMFKDTQRVEKVDEAIQSSTDMDSIVSLPSNSTNWTHYIANIVVATLGLDPPENLDAEKLHQCIIDCVKKCTKFCDKKCGVDKLSDTDLIALMEDSTNRLEILSPCNQQTPTVEPTVSSLWSCYNRVEECIAELLPVPPHLQLFVCLALVFTYIMRQIYTTRTIREFSLLVSSKLFDTSGNISYRDWIVGEDVEVSLGPVGLGEEATRGSKRGSKRGKGEGARARLLGAHQ
jgi:hypothetical protein